MPACGTRLLILLLHHAAHVKLGEASRNLEQTRRLRTFLNVLQFSTIVLSLPFHRKAQFRVEPHRTAFALRIRAFILHRTASVHSFIADLMARAALVTLLF